ncbi:hypothetical protein EMIT019CA3_230006 [Bacillus pseudomycoides]|nr:hypothetical protein DJ94_5276 [Bacillus pseudomycoides]
MKKDVILSYLIKEEYDIKGFWCKYITENEREGKFLTESSFIQLIQIID